MSVKPTVEEEGLEISAALSELEQDALTDMPESRTARKIFNLWR